MQALMSGSARACRNQSASDPLSYEKRHRDNEEAETGTVHCMRNDADQRNGVLKNGLKLKTE
jgi:hypothetical protein